MTVRWKPLIVLSGLFVAVALCGLVAFVLVSGQADREEILAQARTSRGLGKFDDAEIYYLQASQLDSRRAEVYQELAEFYGEWLGKADPSKRAHLAGLRLRHLLEATKFDKTALAPRQALLAESLKGDNPAEQAHWAAQVAALDPEDPDALFLLANGALDASPPNVNEAVRLLESLKEVAPGRARTSWVEARIAQYNQDREGLGRILASALGQGSEAGGSDLDQLSRLRLMVLDFELASSAGDQEQALGRISEQADLILAKDGVQATRIVELQRLARQVRATLVQGDPDSADARWEPLAEAIDRGFQAALKGDDMPGIWVHQAYAEHLNLRGHREACLKVIEDALTPEVLKDASFQDDVMRLRETAIKAALAQANDPGRFAKAQAHIDALVSSTRPAYQGLGHLFQGAIDLERSGITGPKGGEGVARPNAALGDARDHLREATVKLPQVALAKALYGISLLMSGETSLGRQHLLDAERLSRHDGRQLEPRYRVWAAWSLLEADYPEEAERIVNSLLDEANRDPSFASLAGTLRLLQGEIARSRRSPQDLEVARAAYAGAIVDGEEVPPAVSIRLAELTIALDGPGAGLKQLEEVREHGGGSPALEALAISTLVQLDRIEDARTTLDAARRQYPDDSQLALLNAAFELKLDRAEEADRVLATFLDAHPDDVSVAQTRARILAAKLDRVDEARAVLTEVGERSGVTAPYVQLAMLDLSQGDRDAAAEAVATIRSRWPEAAAGDLLDAQIRLTERDFVGASKSLDQALQKDPSNKVALFWKAQLDTKGGSPARAAEIFEAILRDRPIKELGDGLSLSTAAEWSLAEISMANKDFDAAIARLESIVQGDAAGSMERAARWKLIDARSAKGRWAEARKELIALLNEPESTIDERVQAADFFRKNGEAAVADKLIDQVLDRDPAHSGALLIKAFLLNDQGRPAEAAERLRAAIAQHPQPPAVYLMLAGLSGEGDSAASTRETLRKGIEAHPQSIDLVRALYELIRRSEGVDPALAFAKSHADSAPDDDRFRKMLVDLYSREGRLDEADELVSTLVEEAPKDADLAAGLVAIVTSKAVQAARQDRRKDELDLDARTLSLVRKFREQFPDDLRFPQAECDLAMRQGDYAKAEAVARQIEQIRPDSPIGPLLRAQIYRDQGLDDRALQAYGDALDDSPHRDDIRLVLGQLLLEVGRADEALVEAGRILDRTPSQPGALLLKAMALASQPGTPDQVAARQDQAVAVLRDAMAEDPSFASAYLEVARIEHLRGRTAEAIASLKTAREKLPKDDQILSDLIRYLVEPPADGSASGESGIAEAETIARASGDGDRTGSTSLALALGFHRGGRPDLAKPWAERAADLVKDPAVYLTFGDILLSYAESLDDPAQARNEFSDAIAMYDRVLAADSKSIEAINNKAWILHRYLGKDQEALDLIEGLLGRVERRTLPAEFFDTLGSIQQSVGRNRDAEQSFAEGLKKSPELAVLNFHMGRLIATDPERSARASQYLARAWDSRDQLPGGEADEVKTLLDRVGR